jgi:ABC-2 type transport system permease protein
MNKIVTIAQREFLSRVQKKTFLLTTILLPLIIFVFYGMIIYFSIKSTENFRIAVADKANIFEGKLNGKDNVSFVFVPNETPESLKAKVVDKTYEGYVYIPEHFSLQKRDSLKLVSGKTVGLITRENIQKVLNNTLEEKRLLSSMQISKSQLDSMQQEQQIAFATVDGVGNDDAKVGVSFAMGYASGFLIYIILFIYGTMVMRGVMEEKTNRIAEVIISSVKPFQLMMGKIIGIGTVGLLQFCIWITLMIGLNLLLPLLFPQFAEQMASQPIQPAGAQAINAVKSSGLIGTFLSGAESINMGMIVACFIFYFLGGYLLYSSLFAAVGSAVNEDPQDAQSLLLPITMPIIFAIVIMTKAVNDPTSGIALFGSLFPLTSPIVMMARIPFGVPETVPYWQLIVSMLLLVLGFIGTTWLSGKIYRVGILMYGKKPTWKEMWKWAFRRN